MSAAQAPFLAELKQTNATDVTPYSLINAFSATMSPVRPSGFRRTPTWPALFPTSRSRWPTAPRVFPRPWGPVVVQGALRNACAKGGQVQLNPQAVLSIHARVESRRPPVGPGTGLHGCRRKGRVHR